MSTSAFCPAVIVQEWRSMAALLSTFGCIRRDAGARLSPESWRAGATSADVGLSAPGGCLLFDPTDLQRLQ